MPILLTVPRTNESAGYKIKCTDCGTVVGELPGVEVVGYLRYLATHRDRVQCFDCELIEEADTLLGDPHDNSIETTLIDLARILEIQAARLSLAAEQLKLAKSLEIVRQLNMTGCSAEIFIRKLIMEEKSDLVPACLVLHN